MQPRCNAVFNGAERSNGLRHNNHLWHLRGIADIQGIIPCYGSLTDFSKGAGVQIREVCNLPEKYRKKVPEWLAHFLGFHAHTSDPCQAGTWIVDII